MRYNGQAKSLLLQADAMLDVEKDCDLVEAHMEFLQMHIRQFCLRCKCEM